MTQIRLVVTLNGTNSNRWHRWNLSQNPFPQLGKHEWLAAEHQVASLDGDPLTGPDDIRQRLAGFKPEFVELCVRNFRPGRRVRFEVYWEED